MKYNDWRDSLKIEYDFLKDLKKICKAFKEIAKACKDDHEEYMQRMQELEDSPIYEKFLYSTVKRMITPVVVANQQTWRKASKKATKGSLIYQLLKEEAESDSLKDIIQAQLVENVNLIKTLPTDTADKVVKDVFEYTLKGKRSSSIAKIIQSKTDQHAKASAKLIARTEVAKVSSAITQARSKNLDINWYVWRTALDGDRVRKSHRNMEGVLVNWDYPPSPEALVGETNVGEYHAGNIWNCRCYSEPLIDSSLVHWPHRVYWEGKIQTMSEAKFNSLG